MKIRAKLLLLLLLIAVAPLVLVSWLTSRSTRELSGALAARARESLTDRARYQLIQLVESQARVLDGEIRNIELSLELHARAAAAALASPAPPSDRVCFPEDFSASGNPPRDYAPSDRHVCRMGDGVVLPVLVSYSEPVFVTPPGISRENALPDMRRLRSIAPELRRIAREISRRVYWQYVALESGVHMSFPGHGGYPREFDPRRRPWYQAAASSPRVVWTSPLTDASTGEVVVAASVALRDPSGNLLGVAGLDVAVRTLYDVLRVPATWGPRSELFVVAAPRTADAASAGLSVLAQQEFEQDEPSWDVPLRAPRLISPDGDEFLQALSNMAQRQTGVRRMRIGQTDALWSYAPLASQPAYLVLTVPYSNVIFEATEAENYIFQRTREQLIVMGIALAVVLMAVACAAIIGSQSVTRPIGELAEAADRVASGDLEARVRVRSSDEIGQLGRTFNEMVPQLHDGVRLRESLALAMQVQQSLLPARSPRIDGFDIAGLSVYCDETGGDYYDFLDFTATGPGQIDIVVGDVTGHGVAAALLMATARALLRGHAARSGAISELLTHVNRHLAMDSPLDRYMTLFYARLTSPDRLLRWASAGHDPAMLYSPGSGTFSTVAGVDLPLGVESDLKYSEFGPLRLEPGQIALIGTDGIWEARDESNAMFGKERLCDLIRDNRDRSAREIGQSVIDAVTRFRGRRPQHDDITLVVLKVLNGQPHGSGLPLGTASQPARERERS